MGGGYMSVHGKHMWEWWVRSEVVSLTLGGREGMES